MKKRQQFKIETIEELEACFENLSPWYWGIGTEKECFNTGFRWIAKDEDGDVLLMANSVDGYETIENPFKKEKMMNKLYELIEKKDMETKRIPIEIPNDCEAKFDEENNVLIISKKKEEIYIPDSSDEVKEKKWFSRIIYSSSPYRSNAFGALSELVEMRDYSNGDWRADWKDDNQDKWVIYFDEEDDVDIFNRNSCREILVFKTLAIAKAFLKKHREMIITAKELL